MFILTKQMKLTEIIIRKRAIITPIVMEITIMMMIDIIFVFLMYFLWMAENAGAFSILFLCPLPDGHI